MDIVGPLPRSRRGNWFVLVICDYATRYPEAVPMKHVGSPSKAHAMQLVFFYIPNMSSMARKCTFYFSSTHANINLQLLSVYALTKSVGNILLPMFCTPSPSVMPVIPPKTWSGEHTPLALFQIFTWDSCPKTYTVMQLHFRLHPSTY